MARLRFALLIVAALVALTIGTVAAASQRYTLPGDNVFPEGIAADAATGDLYVGSTSSGSVYRGNPSSPDLEVFMPGGVDGRTDVRGLKVGNGKLYLAGGPTAQLFVYDLASKQLLAKFATGLTPSFVNDVTIAPNGDAYFTDSNSPAIYRVAANVTSPGAFSRWIELTGSPIVYSQGFNLNGIAASADGKYLVTVQSNTGKLFRIDIASKAVTEIDLSGQSLVGGDGLLLDGQTLWVMRNAAATLVTLRLSSDFGRATVVATTTDPEFDFPTTIARVGGELLVVNSQLNKRAANTPPTLPFVVLGIPAPGLPPSPPPTGSGGNLPGLPSTGAGGASAVAPPLAPAATFALLTLVTALLVRHTWIARRPH
jgi:Cu-Zn family superoxide dismutase